MRSYVLQPKTVLCDTGLTSSQDNQTVDGGHFMRNAGFISTAGVLLSLMLAGCTSPSEPTAVESTGTSVEAEAEETPAASASWFASEGGMPGCQELRTAGVFDDPTWGFTIEQGRIDPQLGWTTCQFTTPVAAGATVGDIPLLKLRIWHVAGNEDAAKSMNLGSNVAEALAAESMGGVTSEGSDGTLSWVEVDTAGVHGTVVATEKDGNVMTLAVLPKYSSPVDTEQALSYARIVLDSVDLAAATDWAAQQSATAY